MRWGLRSQLVLPVMLLLVGVAGISLTTALSAARQARQQIDAHLQAVARFLAQESQFPLTSDVLRQLRPLSGAEYLLVTEGGQRRTSLATDPGDVPLAAPIVDDWMSFRPDTPILLQDKLYSSGAIRLRRGSHAGDVLYILYPDALWQDARWQAIRPSLFVGGSIGLAALGLALLQARRLSRRVRELERRTRLIAAGDFSPMAIPPRNDEIRDLICSINEMAQQLAALQKTVAQTERLRLLGQVSSGLAHQMRNGLTGARLAVQLYLHEASPSGVDSTPLEVSLRQLRLLESLVRRFLDLGRAGAPRTEACDLGQLLDEAVELIRPQCRHTGIALTWSRPEKSHGVQGDPSQLGHVFVNVLMNALEAAGPGGWVVVRLGAAETFHIVEVLDSGPGPPLEVAEHLFEPFVTSKPEGVGLGLAVAHEVIERHGGRLGWSRDEGQTCFRIEIPRG
ncbi:MAG: HAMP domain-containing sensor histidine kinase [Gemmataceae bacterium]